MIFQKYGKSFLLSTTLVLGGLHLGTWVQNDVNFRLRHVIVKGNVYLEQSTILAAAQIPVGEKTFDVDIVAVRQRVEALPFVREAKVTRILPSTIEISVSEKQPVALLNHDGLWPVDRHGFVLPAIEAEVRLDVPVVSGELLVPDPRTQRLPIPGINLSTFIGHLHKEKPVLYHQISEFHLDANGELTLFLLGDGAPALLGKQRWLERCERLHTLLQYLAASGKRTQILDLRYDNQVVVREVASG